MIRRANRSDVEEIVRLLADDFLGKDREEYTMPLPVYYYDAFDEIDQDPKQLLVVAEYDGKVVGTMQMTFIKHIAFKGSLQMRLESVQVDESLRGRGIGRYMIGWALERAREKGCVMAYLNSIKIRTEAHRFYEQLGFSPSHEGFKISLLPIIPQLG